MKDNNCNEIQLIKYFKIVLLYTFNNKIQRWLY